MAGVAWIVDRSRLNIRLYGIENDMRIIDVWYANGRIARKCGERKVDYPRTVGVKEEKWNVEERWKKKRKTCADVIRKSGLESFRVRERCGKSGRANRGERRAGKTLSNREREEHNMMIWLNHYRPARERKVISKDITVAKKKKKPRNDSHERCGNVECCTRTVPYECIRLHV